MNKINVMDSSFRWNDKRRWIKLVPHKEMGNEIKGDEPLVSNNNHSPSGDGE